MDLSDIKQNIQSFIADETDLHKRIALINDLKQKLHDVSPFKNEPVDCVLWVAGEEVIANDYNPNSVAPPEMKLLEVSIAEDGYTQPIVTWSKEKTYEVVDGFHRNRVGKESKEVLSLQNNIHGCGMITACSIMAELTTVKRFASKDNLSSYAGITPTERSSGRKNKVHTNPFGNRRLNKCLHTIALAQIACKGDPRGKEYYTKKVKEGKTKLWALRCLKHQIAKRVFQTLKQVK